MYGTEKAVLFYMLEGLDLQRLNEDLFSYQDNKIIFREIRKAKAEGAIIDLVSLAERLEPGIKTSYVSSLGDGVIQGKLRQEYFVEYVNRLLRAKKERDIKAQVERQINEPDFIPGLIETLADYELETAEKVEDFSVASHSLGFRGFLEKKRAGKLWGHDVPSLPLLTAQLMGWREIIVLAAKPKVGKSTLALQIASDIHGQGVGVLYYDFENGPYNLMAREVSRTKKIEYREVLSGSDITGRGDVVDRAAIIESGIIDLEEKYGDFAIISDRKLNIDKIRGHISQMRKITGREDVFLVIDSLQKLPMENLKERRAAVDSWLRNLEELKAESPELTILLISELSREAGKPKESGDIEYTAHFFLELRTNREEKEIQETGDDNKRKVFLNAARDVEIPASPFTYEVNFHYWTFKET